MNKLCILLAGVAAIALTSPASAEDATYKAKTTIKQKDDGSYEKKTTEKLDDAHGTTSNETSVDTDVNRDGTMEKTVKTESVDDPKGLFNKQKTITKDTVKTDKNGEVTSKHTKKVNGDTVEDTEKKSTY